MPNPQALIALIISASMAYGFLKGLSLAQIVNFQSILIVAGGLCLVAFIGFPPRLIRSTFQAVREAAGSQNDPEEGLRRLLMEALELARTYRLRGPAELERAAASVRSGFLSFGATLVAEGYDKLSLMAALERQRRQIEGERRAQIRLLSTLTRLAPSLGMAGTVVSLMQVMQDLGVSSDIGPSMSLALSSTLYGILLANLVFLPMASKIEELARQESALCSAAAEALMGIRDGLHPLRIAERLDAYELYLEMVQKKTHSSNPDRQAEETACAVLAKAAGDK